jgi:threonine synthase
MAIDALRCKECRAEYDLGAHYVCERCFGPLEVSYSHEPVKDVAAVRRRIQGGPQNIWRYAEFLPLEAQPAPSRRESSRAGLPAGCTPLVRADRLAERLGLGEVWVKNDAANPTHSFKDRVVAVAGLRARELGFETLACASTGNLANAVAAHAAAAGLPAYVFIPADLEEAKILATGAYGATVVGVRGNYDQVNRLVTELQADRPDWAFVNVNVRPYYAEGSKTLGFEVAEQLGWRRPGQIVIPVASGSQLTKVDKGLAELGRLGLVEETPYRIFGAQAEGCSPVARAFRDGQDVVRPVRPDTIAKSLAIGNPADGPYVLDAVRRTGGAVESVTDDEVRDGIQLLARTEGIFAETAGGVTVATLKKLVDTGRLDPDVETVVFNTGDGLKTLDAIADRVGPAATIDPSYAAFRATGL